MIPLAIQAWIGVGIAGCVAGIYELRAEVRAIHVPKLPARWRKAARGRHRKHWWERSTMERWTRAIQRAQERADIYVEPDWYDELRTRGFRPIDVFDLAPVGGVDSYEQLQPAVLEGAITREFRRLTGPSVWGTPVDVDDWEPAEPVLQVSRG
jgi:hypothetical protein